MFLNFPYSCCRTLFYLEYSSMNLPSPDNNPKSIHETEAQLAVKQGQILFLANKFSEGLQGIFHSALLLLTQDGVNIRVLKDKEGFKENALEVVRLRAELKSLILESNQITDVLDPAVEQRDLSAVLGIYKKQVTPFLKKFSENISQIYRFKLGLVKKFESGDTTLLTKSTSVKSSLESFRISDFNENDFSNLKTLEVRLREVSSFKTILPKEDISLAISDRLFVTVAQILSEKFAVFRYQLGEKVIKAIVEENGFYDLLPKADVDSQDKLSDLVDQICEVQKFQSYNNKVVIKLNQKGSLLASLSIPPKIWHEYHSLIKEEVESLKTDLDDLARLSHGIGTTYTVVDSKSTNRINIRIKLPLRETFNSESKLIVNENNKNEDKKGDKRTIYRDLESKVIVLPKVISIADGRDSFSYSLPVYREFLEDPLGTALIHKIFEIADYVVKNCPELRNILFCPNGFHGIIEPYINGDFSLRFAGASKGSVHSLGARELRKADRFCFIDSQVHWKDFPISDFDNPETLVGKFDQESMICIPEYSLSQPEFIKAVVALAKEAEPTQIGNLRLSDLALLGEGFLKEKELYNEIYQQITKYFRDALRVVKEVKTKTNLSNLMVKLIPAGVCLDPNMEYDKSFCTVEIFDAISRQVICSGFFCSKSDSFQYQIISQGIRQQAKQSIMEAIHEKVFDKEFFSRKFDRALLKKKVYIPESLVFEIQKTANGIRPDKYLPSPSYAEIVNTYVNSSVINIYKFEDKIIMYNAPDEVLQDMPHVYGVDKNNSKVEVTDFLEARKLYLEDRNDFNPSAGFRAELLKFEEALEFFK